MTEPGAPPIMRPMKRLAPVFRKYRVRFAYLWGSRVRGRARPSSDVDLAVSLPIAPRALDPFLDLCSAICASLGRDDVDVTLLEDANLEIRFLVQHTGRLIHEADPAARAEFEHTTRLRYWDEAVRLRRYDAAMERRLREGTFGR